MHASDFGTPGQITSVGTPHPGGAAPLAVRALPSVVLALGALQWPVSARPTELPPLEQSIGPLEPNDRLASFPRRRLMAAGNSPGI